jgi:hypothetical protein
MCWFLNHTKVFLFTNTDEIAMLKFIYVRRHFSTVYGNLTILGDLLQTEGKITIPIG